MMKKVWKVCVTLIMVCTLLPANVYAESGLTLESSLESATDTPATEKSATVSVQTEDIRNMQEVADTSEEGDATYLNAAVSERADSDGDADLPAFLQEGESACGSVSSDQILSPSTATVSDVVSIIQPIIYTNEVGASWNTKYGSVMPNDNGYGISAGILQWNASNALYLLRAIIVASDAEAQQILDADLYHKIKTDTSWAGGSGCDNTRFIPTDAQATAISNLLKSPAGVEVQNNLSTSYIYSYIDRAYNTYKITNVAALCYFCDINNQCSPTTAGNIAQTAIQLAGGKSSDVTLNEMHEAALLNPVAGKYLYRRYLTYSSIADAVSGTGWNYCNAGSYRIPAKTVGTSTSSTEIKWLQWALNAAVQAALPVDGTYSSATTTAIRTFQTQYQATYGLAVDGYAGQQTITSLIKVLSPLGLLTYHSNDLKMVEPVLKGAVNTASGVIISWEPVSNATGYYVYRKDNGGDYHAIGTISSSSTVSYSDTAVSSGTTYTYTVKAYDSWRESSFNQDGISILFLQAPVSQEPDSQTADSQTTDPQTPVLQAPNLKAAVMTTTGIKVSWSQVSGATGYYVYRKVGGGSYHNIKTIKAGTTVSYTDKTTKSGTTYTYTVKAYNESVTSAYNKGISQTYKTVKKYKVLSKLNYRKGAGKKYTAVGTLKKSSTAYVVKGYSKKANGYTWYKIYYKNKFYYVASKYLKKI